MFSPCLGIIRQHQKMDMASPQPGVPLTPEATQKANSKENWGREPQKMTGQCNRGSGKASLAFSYGMPARKKPVWNGRSQRICEKVKKETTGPASEGRGYWLALGKNCDQQRHLQWEMCWWLSKNLAVHDVIWKKLGNHLTYTLNFWQRDRDEPSISTCISPHFEQQLLCVDTHLGQCK